MHRFYMHYTKIIHNVREKTDTVILFHSGTGKDSIMLLDLCSKSFKKVICVFMYIVKDLDYENRYINWALKKIYECRIYKNTSLCCLFFYKIWIFGYKKR